MIDPININAVLDAVSKKEIELTPEYLIKITDSSLSTYSVLELMCDYFNSVSEIRANKDAEVLCKHKAAEKLLKTDYDALSEKYNKTVTDLLTAKEGILDLKNQITDKTLKNYDLEARIRELECELERVKLFL